MDEQDVKKWRGVFIPIKEFSDRHLPFDRKVNGLLLAVWLVAVILFFFGVI